MCWFFRGQTNSREDCWPSSAPVCILFTSASTTGQKCWMFLNLLFWCVSDFWILWGKTIQLTDKKKQRAWEKEMFGIWRTIGCTPTYFEPGSGYRSLGVALIQRDDSDDVLCVGLQTGQSVKLTVTGNLHSLHIPTFEQRSNKISIQLCKFGEKKSELKGKMIDVFDGVCSCPDL